MLIPIWKVKWRAMVLTRPKFSEIVEDYIGIGFLFMPKTKAEGCPECGQKRITFKSAGGNVLLEACECGHRQVSVRRLLKV